MRTYTIRRWLSPKRKEWLEKLAREGVAQRPKSNVGYHCMRLGWTEWAFLSFLGVQGIISHDEARRQFGDGWWEHGETVGEMLTDAGRAMLLAPGA